MGSILMKRVAIITGSSSGFGLLTALELARRGYLVVATMRELSRSGPLLQAAERQGLSDCIEIAPLDVTAHEEITRAVEDVLRIHGRIDVLINNAGFAAGGYAEEVSMTTWRAQFETNVFGLIAMTQAVLPHMRENRRGRIIQLGSISGLVGFPGLSPYNASKYAVEGFSEALRLELLPYHVYVSVVEPGSYRTAIWEKGMETMDARRSSPYSDKLQALKSRVGHTAAAAGNPESVASLIGRIADHPKPRLRYPIGNGIRATLWAKRLLPWRTWEQLVNRMLSRD